MISDIDGLKILKNLPVLVHEKSHMAIISDIHLGYEGAMASQGVYLPRLQLKRARNIINEIANEGIKKIAVAGDLKHVFEKLTRQERAEVLELLGYSIKKGIKEIVLIRGNHDTFIGPLLRSLGIEIVEDRLDLGSGVTVIHGHKSVDLKGSDYVVMGHEHPTIEIDLSGSRIRLQVLFKLPLKNGRVALVLPAIGLYQTGTVVTLDRSSYLSPITRKSGIIEEGVPIIVDREIGVIELAKLRIILGSKK